MHVRTVSFHENLCDTLAFMLVVSIVWGALYSAGSGSPSELGSKLAAHWDHGRAPAASWFQMLYLFLHPQFLKVSRKFCTLNQLKVN